MSGDGWGSGRFPLGYGDKTKVLWKPLLTQNPAMGLSEFQAKWESVGTPPISRLAQPTPGDFHFPKIGSVPQTHPPKESQCTIISA